ncbi:S9 family peptidase [Polycladidibacter stylochi]|uniref:S9 family peptidase n=1 Tax=Polycladidibacter stylochi TaxID=1807766 RepID=UPI000AEACB5E|nr:S9 family peptidase [Pseudovibrio stylochi]
MKATSCPPCATIKPVQFTEHGTTRMDNYSWLRADNWQEVMKDPSVLSADIREYLEAENAYTNTQMADTETLQSTLYQEMKGRIKEDDSSVPSNDGTYAYALKYIQGGQHPIFYRLFLENNHEEILLDGDKEAKDKAYFKIAGASHSDDHRFLAWAYDDKGSEYYSLKIRDLASGKDMDEIITDTGSGGVWSSCGKYIFYVRLDENHRPSKLFRHEVGTDSALDALVYEEKDAGFFMGVSRSQSGAYIIIDIHDHETSEVRILRANSPLGTPEVVQPRVVGVEYSLEDRGDELFILSNINGAEDFKISSVNVHDQLKHKDPNLWKDVVSHQQGCLIRAMTVYKDYFVRLETYEGLPRIVIHAFEGNVEHEIAFAEEAYSLGMIDGYEFETTNLRFTYSSMTTPTQTYDYDMATRSRVLRKTQEIPSGHNSEDYITRRVFAPSHDGALVPISLLYHKDTALDGQAPCLLYGYGSYGISIPASFQGNALSLVDRGFVYAIAHIRGGKDKGFEWYKTGRRETKKNTFYDFIAACSYLNDKGYTSYERVVAHGGSAGGMLMGAVANMAPDRFSGIIAEVPFVDVLSTMLDDTLPLTPPEWPEWGNPITSEGDYRYIASYSPIDNVSAQDYPAIFALGGLTDPRVTYWEPAKWVAKLRAKKTSDSLLMLRTNMDAGHGGASGRFERLKEVALVYAFAIKVAQSTGNT